MTPPAPSLRGRHDRLIAWLRERRVLFAVLLALSVLLEIGVIATVPRGAVSRTQALLYILPGFFVPLFFLPLWYTSWFSARHRGPLFLFKTVFFFLAAVAFLVILASTLIILFRHG